MAYNNQVSPATPRDEIGYVGDATTRTDSVKRRWAYATSDVAATVETANYFDAETAMSRGDIIEASMNNATGQTPVFKQYVVVTGINSGDAHNTIALQAVTAG